MIHYPELGNVKMFHCFCSPIDRTVIYHNNFKIDSELPHIRYQFGYKSFYILNFIVTRYDDGKLHWKFDQPLKII
ncbi:hypothetical protein A3D72_04250 [Candidatus Uhrbacteria bacterium RIFCSPHIGHO2_02_FULL_57_19]|uniref:Uncharacterized protein n=1 Tax=Candidatus Uhrbacteria bacterium RIFCSPHIGHO2_02_FULL_57_19 TaxID=1802391 RepID=A0A1F7U3C6_9BACT|nr:MAG: hypothetical protein A3D72_04250 [Candidatus Uhrbacteria bacterium RIFCSPHIGHO2_02_FULL_57_19]